MRNKKVKLLLVLVTATISFALGGCGQEHEHEWEDATCRTPKTCVECGETTGEALGHEWEDATCTTPKTCIECGETKGDAIGHKWEDATCGKPKTCVECGKTEGEVTGHTLNSDGKCTACGEQVGIILDSSNYKNYLNVDYDIVLNDVPKYYMCACEIEPLKNATFENVEITLKFLNKNQKSITQATYSISKDGNDTLYCRADGIENCTKVEVVAISGYVIE